MDFVAVIDQARALLQSKGRVAYRTLKRQFGLDDEALDDLKVELIKAERVARDEEGEILVWVGDGEAGPVPTTTQSHSHAPASYTPPHLAERIRAEQAAMESRGATDGERKTITALFADLKGSTALIEGLDPEDARAIIDPTLQLMMDAVHRYDGYVAQALGDGIFALFGAPIAHEDHPQRALYAALRMQEDMRNYSDKLREEGAVPLQMRVGVNTGEVVVRSIRKDDLHADYVPVGHSTNIAARMEQLANPGSILVTEQTYKLTDGYFTFTALGQTKVKGIEAPVPIYEVTGAGPLRTRLQVSARRGLTRFVGRHAELDQMRQALDQAKAGHGQIVGVMGEPGLGKSRLFYEFKLISQSGCLVLEAFAVSYGKASPYLPIIELLKQYFQIEPTDDERIRKEKVGGRVLMLDRSLEHTLPYLFALLGIEDEQSSLQQMDAQIRRQRTLEALKNLFLRESLNQPLLLIFEDLHWIDSETQGFLDSLSESIVSAQLLLLVNYRPEYRHEWGQKTYYTQLRLAPLGKAEAEEFLTFFLGSSVGATGRSPLHDLKQLILERTDGTPFFMEEVVQTLVEEGALQGTQGGYHLETTPTELTISPTVQGVLAARIDRLSAEEKALLQQLSVIGRQFPVSLVKQVVTQSEDDLYRILSSLQAKEFLYEQPAFPESEFIFKHALTQDVAYGTVLQEQRKALHERTGQAIEALYGEKLEDHYGELAHHYSQSANTEKAIEYLYLAGQQATQRSAYVEATSHLSTALELLQTLPAGREQAEQELQVQLALGGALMVTQSFIGPELEHIYQRALDLARHIGDTARQFTALRGLSFVGNSKAEWHTVGDISEQLLQLAEEDPSPDRLMEAHYSVGLVASWRGELLKGRAHMEEAVRLYDPQQHAFLRYLYGQDPGVNSRTIGAYGVWVLGYSEQAQRMSKDAIALGQEITHPNSTAFAFVAAAGLYLHCRAYALAQECAETARTISTEHDYRWWTAMADIFGGGALAGQGRHSDGIERIRQGVAAERAIRDIVTWLPMHLAILAGAYGKAYQADEGLSVLDEALQTIQTTGERWYEAELCRLKGELTLQQSHDVAEAESCFHQAIDIAQQQSAKSWELRAATSLARLWQRQGKTTEAHALLAPVYNWFTEGFDTADLKDAKALLAELSEGQG